VPWLTDQLTPGVRVLFRFTGLAVGLMRRIPLDLMWQTWDVPPERVRPIVEAIAPSVPNNPATRFVVGKIPGLSAAAEASQLVAERVTRTREVEAIVHGTVPAARPITDASGPRAPGGDGAPNGRYPDAPAAPVGTAEGWGGSGPGDFDLVRNPYQAQ
jgi:hypothetical protein